MAAPGTVYLVGAGPGDPGLLTLRGAELLGRADVVVYDGLVGDALLVLAAPDAEMIYAGKKRSAAGAPLTQFEIADFLVEKARDGKAVVRLKGGDPLIFGRVSEELDALIEAGLPYEIVPGVSALTAAPAYAGIPITRRGVASTVAFATGHAAAGRELDDDDFAAIAAADTIVLFMAVSTLERCTERLIAAGRAPETPAAAIYWGTTASQKTVTATLGELARAADEAALKPPALIVIGEVAAAENRYNWHKERPLAGARVLIGRPRGRSDAFSDEIARLGGEPLVAPLTRLAALDEAARAAALAHLEAPCDWIVFSSASAVEYLVAGLLEVGRDIRALGAAKIAAVGESTRAALTAVGLRADLVPETRSSAGIAEALVGQGVGGGRVLVVRADGGRDDAEVALARHGATAIALPLYRSVPADATEPALARALSRVAAAEIDIAPFFAPSQVDAFYGFVGDGTRALGKVRVVAAIGKTTAAALTRRGARVDVVASSPEAATFCREITAAFRRERHL